MMISEVSIRRPVFAWMLMVGLIGFGFLFYKKIGVSQNPDVDFPFLNVFVLFEGAAPEVMEKDVIDPLESVIVTIEGIKKISSSARNGQANITVEFNLNKDIDVALQEVQTAIATARKQLPTAVEPPLVTKTNPEDRPIMWVSVRSESMELKDLMFLVRNQIRDQFSILEGVAEITLGGYVEPALRVNLDIAKLDRYELTTEDIFSAIQREHVELPAGRIDSPLVEKSVRVMGEALTPEEFSKISIKRRGGAPNFRPIPLYELAEVKEDLSEIRRISRVNQKPSVGLGIRKQRGTNSVQVADRVKEKLAIVKAQLPPGVEMDINFDSTPFIRESVRELLFTIFLSALLTSFVCWLFLGSLSSTLNILLAIPTSVMGSFIFIYIFNFTLNTFTLLGLSLAIGIVVDDAIIVLENIFRHRDMGKNKVRASLDGSKEVLFAVLATTLALVAIFVPVTFMDGIIGRFFIEFAATICVAVSLSSLEAMTLAPMRCSQYLHRAERDRGFGHWFETSMESLSAAYGSLLRFFLNHRVKVLIIAVALFAPSIFLLKQVPREFSPKVDEGRLFMIVKTKEGSSMQFTSDRMSDLEEILIKEPYVDVYFAAVGGFQGGESNSGILFLTLKPKPDRGEYEQFDGNPSQSEIVQILREKFAKVEGVRVFIQESSSGALGGGRGFPVEFTVKGPDWNELGRHTSELKKALEAHGDFVEVNMADVAGVQEVHVVPDRQKAEALGVDISEISRAVQVIFGGIPAGLYSKGGQRFDVLLQANELQRDDIRILDRLKVRNNRGELVSIRDVVKVEEKSMPLVITRQDRVRAISVTSNLREGAAQADAMNTVAELAKKTLPTGYFISTDGGSQIFAESFRSLFIALILGITVAYMVLGSQFNSFVDPIVVFTAIPFALTGAFLGLLATGQTLNIYSMIGIILLMGIVKKNSILMVDFTNQMREEGLGAREALLKACPLRLRPILMTVFSTVAAAIPAAFNTGPGAETRIPMAVVVIGGSLLSTFFTLFLVPVLYDLISPKRLTFEERLERG